MSNITQINENINKNEVFVLKFTNINNIKHTNSIKYSETINPSPNTVINIKRSNTLCKKKNKKVSFNPNCKLIEKIFYDPNEPAIKHDKKTEREIEKINALELKRKLDRIRKIQLKKNAEDKINAQCTCLIF